MITPAPVFVALRYLAGRAPLSFSRQKTERGTARNNIEGGRYLRGAAAGIALSLVPIIVTLVVSDGMIGGITSRYIELGTSHIQIYDDLNGDPGLALEVLSLARRDSGIEGISGVWRERQGLGIILGDSGRFGATIRAVDPEFWTEKGSRNFLEVLAGSAELESDREVLLGKNLAENLKAEPGSLIRLMTVQVNDDGESIPRVTLFTVKGIISSGYRELDALWCIMTYDAGLELLSPELYRSFLLVKTSDPYHGINTVAREITFWLGPLCRVYTWEQLEQSLYSSFASTKQLLLFIMAILVIVAAVNVSSATSMLTIERQRDIAVLKTCGTSPGKISAIFLWGSFLTGLTGAAAGAALGVCAGWFINPIIRGLERLISFFTSPWSGEVRFLDPDYYLEEIPVSIDWKMVFIIMAFTVLCSVLASFIPARRAGKLKPLEILRKI